MYDKRKGWNMRSIIVFTNLLFFGLGGLTASFFHHKSSEEIAQPTPLVQQLAHHEGFSSTVYLDRTGKRHIGYGRNLDDVGISEEEAEYLLKKDIERSRSSLTNTYTWFAELDSVRQDALVNMVYNMGMGSFSQFRRMHFNLARHLYTGAAYEAIDSRWARQVGKRAFDVAFMLETGKYPVQRKVRNYGNTSRNNHSIGRSTDRWRLEALGDEATGSGGTKQVLLSDVQPKGRVVPSSSSDKGQTHSMDPKDNRPNGCVFHYPITKTRGHLFGYNSYSWMDGDRKWVPLFYRRQGNLTLERVKWSCYNTA